MCQNFNAAVTRCNSSPKGDAQRCCARFCRHEPLERRRRRYRVIGTGKAPDSGGYREARSSAASALACPRREHVCSLWVSGGGRGLEQNRGPYPLSPILRSSVRPHGQRDMDDLSPLTPASRSQGANARCRQCERRYGAARRSGCRPACLRSPASARLRRELQGSKSGY